MPAGAATAGDGIEVLLAGAVIDTGNIAADGGYSIVVTAPGEGTQVYTYRIIDAVGNVSGASPALSVQVDATIAGPSLAQPLAGDDIVNAQEAGALSLGGTAEPGSTVTVARTDAMEVYAEVDEDYFVRIAPGQRGTLIFPSVPDQKFAATVTRVGPEVDPDRGIIGVHLEPETLPKFVVPGLTADVAIELKQVKGRAVPRTAVIREGADSYVFVVSDGQAARRDIEVLAEGEEYLAVEGLTESAVIASATEVQAGDRVKVRESR